MGTRSLTIIHDDYMKDAEGNPAVLVTLYRQFDGYMVGHGWDLSKFLCSVTRIDGISSDDRGKSPFRIGASNEMEGDLEAQVRYTFNGNQCLAAQVVAAFKTEVGNFYLYPSGTRGVGEEYVYKIYGDEKGSLRLECWKVSYEGDDQLIIAGTPQEVYDHCVAERELEAKARAARKAA